ncbi:MAG: thioredoxin [Clostridia bacterium]|nr:thioredoxin [Clostridia bacterium]
MEITLTLSNFEEEVLRSDVPVVVDFWATWCGPCRMIAPEVEALAEEYDGKVKVGKVNVDEEEELAVKYRVSSIPTLILFKNGEAVKKSIGYKTKDALVTEFGL